MRIKLLKFILIAALILSFVTAAAAESGGGGGDGDGSGGGNHPELVESSVLDGQTGVSVNLVIDLVFSNNVVHFSISENNKRSFALLDESNTAVPIDVIMGDEQVDPSIRRNISVAPLRPLEYGTRYTLVIYKSLTARNGNAMAADVTLTFTTEIGSVPAHPDPPPTNTPDNTEAPGRGEEAGPPDAQPAETTVPQDEAGAATDVTQSEATAPDEPDRTPAQGETSETQDAPESAQENRTAQQAAGSDAETGENPANAESRELRATPMTYIVLAAAVALAGFAVFYFRKR